MRVADLEELVARHESNVLKAVELETGFKIDECAPRTLIDSLKLKLDSCLVDGVSFHDVNELKSHPELDSLTEKLDPNQFSPEPSFSGLHTYRTVVQAALQILKA